MKKISNVLSCFIPLLCAVGLQIIVSIAGTMVYAVVQGIRIATSGQASAITEANIQEMLMGPNLMVGLSALASLSYWLVFSNWFKSMKQKAVQRKLKDAFTVRKVILLVCLGFGMQFGVSAILNNVMLWQPAWFEHYNKLMESISGGNPVLSFVLIVIIAPFAEEFVFRGVTFEMARSRMSLLWANVLQAALFGLFHMNLIQGIYAFVLGLFLGVVYIQFQSIYASIALHAVFNFSGGLTSYVFTESNQNNLLLSLAVLLTSIGIVYVSMSFIQKEEKIEEIPQMECGFVEMDE